MKNIAAMNKEQLDDLISKYYRGETSLEEEETLFAHYNGSPIHTLSDPGQAQFTYFKTKKEEEPSAAFVNPVESLWMDKPATKAIHFRLLFRIAAVVIVALGLGWYFLAEKNARSIHTVRTKAGEQTRIVLPDSTVVWINEMTELQYANNFQQRQRNVWLKGEAYFEVHSDTSRPFIVHTGKVSTTVVGTAFNLRSYDNEKIIALDVTHGRAHFGATQKVDVQQGQGARFDLRRYQVETMASNPNANAWKTRQLVFEDTAMQDVLRDLEHYFHAPFEAEDPVLLHCHFKATFQNATAEEVLDVIDYSLHIRHSFQDGKYILSGQNCEEQ
ncbi:FecR family protein [Chryseolinea soli]|uniref:DUF4974 domain-containing protein n=1 Tax=Chryseolinea soli TaxID=2321403 RepID=A0A385SQL9_9BACT|nr:FecR domain-containing protein [Chryseolinea soli]AYB33459.1 DUF4974 domain-containing protein [Chryseolinea soli]